MPELIETQGGADFPPPPAAGVYPALCTEHIYGPMEFPVYGDNGPTGERETLPGLQYVFVIKDTAGTVHQIRTKRMKYKAQAHTRSNLVKFFKNWLGEIPSRTEDAQGQSALLNLITSITPLPTTMAAEVNQLRIALSPQQAATPTPAPAQTAQQTDDNEPF